MYHRFYLQGSHGKYQAVRLSKTFSWLLLWTINSRLISSPLNPSSSNCFHSFKKSLAWLWGENKNMMQLLYYQHFIETLVVFLLQTCGLYRSKTTYTFNWFLNKPVSENTPFMSQSANCCSLPHNFQGELGNFIFYSQSKFLVFQIHTHWQNHNIQWKLCGFQISNVCPTFSWSLSWRLIASTALSSGNPSLHKLSTAHRDSTTWIWTKGNRKYEITSRTHKICTRKILHWPLYWGQRSYGGQSHVTCVSIPSGHPDQDESMYVAAVANLLQC